MLQSLMCLITLIIISQHVHSTVIIINTTGGSDNTTCCVDGECDCSSLSTALRYINSSTTINITSQVVELNDTTTIGSAYGIYGASPKHVIIAGNGATTIMCNHSGSVYCDICYNVIIKGIIWDRCEDHSINHQYAGGVSLLDPYRILLINCTFQHSQITAVVIRIDSGIDVNVTGHVTVINCNFIANLGTYSYGKFGGLSITKDGPPIMQYINIRGCSFHHNGYASESNLGVESYGLNIVDTSPEYIAYTMIWDITISNTIFSSNCKPLKMKLNGQRTTITLTEVYVYNNTMFDDFFDSNNGVVAMSTGYNENDNASDTTISIISSVFSGNSGTVLSVNCASKRSVTISISNTTFSSNINNNSGNSIVKIYVEGVRIVQEGITEDLCTFSLMDVVFANNTVCRSTVGTIDTDSLIVSGILDVHLCLLNMTYVQFVSNVFSDPRGGAVYTRYACEGISLEYCSFANNTSIRGAAIYVDDQGLPSDFKSTCYNNFVILIKNSTFHGNTADDSIVYIDDCSKYETAIHLRDSNFTNNVGVCLFLPHCEVDLQGEVLFNHNTANSGAALYLNQGSQVYMYGPFIQFVNNSAALYGGAIYIDLGVGCNDNDVVVHCSGCGFVPALNISFINNIAGYGGNSIYFSVSKHCSVVVNSSHFSSLMYIPYFFNYWQLVNNMLLPIPTDYNYTWFNITQFPVVTSPHRLVLHDSIASLTSKITKKKNDAYFIDNKIIGRAVTFKGLVLDYYNKPTAVSEYHVQCIDCSTNWTVLNNQIEIDNVYPVSVTIVGDRIINNINVTLRLTSYQSFYHYPIHVTLVVGLVPCYEHPGYTYRTQKCVCYDHNIVQCNDEYNEIKRGYWFGSVNGRATTSLCPNQYCQFDHNRNKTRDGYYMLPKKINDQCVHHRSGSACGECNPGYTLAYDSTDCISVDNCSIGITVLVVVLTCLYWIAIVAVTFFLVACLKFRISSGYVYGIIYYYSMVGILLSNNPYISDGMLIFINIISGFAQLTPQLLWQFCLTQKWQMSGIDQLFIHYIHAAAISLFLFLFTLVAKHCKKVSLSTFVSRNVIPVFSLLLLLSYTSLTSTSLQLLRPLTFTDINEVYTYSSPDIKYFSGRHVFYGIVAVICELVIGIALPVVLMMEPFFRWKFNLLRFKAFLDEFGNCYKNKYRWFASYYLICRQVIMLIVLVGNDDYKKMMLYLQITCLVIATIHFSVQPYKNKFLNLFDGLILLVMVTVVVMSNYDFLDSVPVVILVVFPTVFLCTINMIKKIANRRKWNYHPIDENEDNIRR